MKKTVAVAVLAAIGAGCSPFTGSDVVMTAENLRVVVAPDATPTAKFAACEATNFLARVFGRNVAIAAAPEAGKVSLILGENKWSKEAGIDPHKLARDGFTIAAQGERVYVCGVDDAKHDPATCDAGYYERATLFGTYEFLDRFAGIRFYFPGEMGTYIPSRQTVTVPRGTFSVTPDFRVRECYVHGGGSYPGCAPKSREDRRARGYYKLTLKEGTWKPQCCHGQNRFKIAERFSTTHPEYFQMRKDGTRCTGTVFRANWMGRQLCHTSKVWDIFERETLERIRKGEEWVDVMPQDGMSACRCANCMAAYEQTNDLSLASGFCTDLMWNHTIDVAKAITKAGLKGGVTQMAYGPCRKTPKADIPDNVEVVLAAGGPWAESRPEICAMQIEFIKQWYEKLGRKICWIWTYPMKNYGRLQAPECPQYAPRAYISYYRKCAKYIGGSYVESNQGGDSIVYNYVNYYMWSKFAWDNDFDVEKALAEHHFLMFGAAAAPAMTKFFDRLEEIWIGKCAIPSLIGETEFGPWLVGPDAKKLWTEIYSPAVLAELDGYLKKAEAAVKPGSMEAKRVAWIRGQFYEKCAAEARKYTDLISVPVELKRRATSKFVDIARGGKWNTSKVYTIDPNAKAWPGSTGALKATANGNAYATFDLAKPLKPDTRYRLSYFVKFGKLEGVKNKQAGVGMEFEQMGANGDYSAQHVPKSTLHEPTDWIHMSGEFITDGLTGTKGRKSTIWARVFSAKGEVWFDGLSVEEIAPVDVKIK